MPPLVAIDPIYAISGLVIGFLVGLTGVGGGSLMTPLLVLVFGIKPYTAVGADLLYASVTKLVGSGVHSVRGTVDWPIVGRLALGSLPAAAITLLILGGAQAHMAQVNRLITGLLGFALIVTAGALLSRRHILDFMRERVGRLSVVKVAWLTTLLGALLGVLVSISSVGAGAIGLTALLALYPKLPSAKLVGTDIAHAAPLTLVAGFGHWISGGVDTHLLLTLAAGSIPGITLGSLLASRVPDPVLRPILATTLALVGGKLMF